jgi:RNA polymerase sigma factor (sigma-70 family)
VLPPFQRLLDEHAETVLRFCAASVGPVDADDCFQETVVAALRAYPKLRHADNLRGWLLTIAHRKALDHHRARSRRAIPGGSGEEVGEPADGRRTVAAAQPQGPPEPERDPELWRAVAQLPPKQRSSVVLRFATGMSHREIGETLDVSEEAARRNVHEGLKTLREEFAA